jgi:hypothetical protein
MAIADIQITPPVLNLDPATREGRFRVQVANQLGREARLHVSLVATGDGKLEWLRLEEKFKQLSVKKDETAIFDVAVVVPADVAPGTYGFKVRCADDLDPANVKVDSEQRDFVVAPALVAPDTASRRKWLLVAAAGVVLVGGGIGLALAVTDGGKKCDPACAAGEACDDGRCRPGQPPVRDAAVAVVDARASSKADACVEGSGAAPCGMCGGVLKCDGSCSVPSPANMGQPCNACGGKVTCTGCLPAPPPNHGVQCNGCGGKINCQGGCEPAMPADFGRVSVKYRERRAAAGGGTYVVGGKCDPGHEIAEVTSRMTNGLGGLGCKVVSHGKGDDCSATISAPPLMLGECETTITQRRGCDVQLQILAPKLVPKKALELIHQ